MDVFKHVIKKIILSFSLFLQFFLLSKFHSVLKPLAHKSLVVALIIAQLQLALSPALALYEEFEEKNRRLTLQVTPTEVTSQFHLKVGLNDGDNVETTILDQFIHFQNNSFTAQSQIAYPIDTSSFLKQFHYSPDFFSFIYRDPLADQFNLRGEGALKFSLDKSGNLTVESKDNMAPTDFIRSLNIINQGRTVTLKGGKKETLNLYGLEVDARHLNKYCNLTIQQDIHLKVAHFFNKDLLKIQHNFFKKKIIYDKKIPPHFNFFVQGDLINEGSISGSAVSIKTTKNIHNLGDIRALKGDVVIELQENAQLINFQDKEKAQEDLKVYLATDPKDKTKYTHRGRISGQSVIIKGGKGASSKEAATQPLVKNNGGLIHSTLHKKFLLTHQERYLQSFIQFHNVKVENVNDGFIQSDHGLLRYLGDELINKAHLYSFSHMILRGGTFKHLGDATLGLGQLKDTLENSSKTVPYGNLYLYMNRGYEIDHDIATLGDISIRLAGNYWPIHLKAHGTLQVDLNQKGQFKETNESYSTLKNFDLLDKNSKEIKRGDVLKSKVRQTQSLKVHSFQASPIGDAMANNADFVASGNLIFQSKPLIWHFFKFLKFQASKEGLTYESQDKKNSYSEEKILSPLMIALEEYLTAQYYNSLEYRAAQESRKYVSTKKTYEKAPGCAHLPFPENCYFLEEAINVPVPNFYPFPIQNTGEINLRSDVIAKGNIQFLVPSYTIDFTLDHKDTKQTHRKRIMHSESGNIYFDCQTLSLKHPEIIAGLKDNELPLKISHDEKTYYGSIILNTMSGVRVAGKWFENSLIGLFQANGHITVDQFLKNQSYVFGKSFYGSIISNGHFSTPGETSIETVMHIDHKDKLEKAFKPKDYGNEELYPDWLKRLNLGRLIFKKHSSFTTANYDGTQIKVNLGGVYDSSKPAFKFTGLNWTLLDYHSTKENKLYVQGDAQFRFLQRFLLPRSDIGISGNLTLEPYGYKGTLEGAFPSDDNGCNNHLNSFLAGGGYANEGLLGMVKQFYVGGHFKFLGRRFVLHGIIPEFCAHQSPIPLQFLVGGDSKITFYEEMQMHLPLKEYYIGGNLDIQGRLPKIFSYYLPGTTPTPLFIGKNFILDARNTNSQFGYYCTQAPYIRPCPPTFFKIRGDIQLTNTPNYKFIMPATLKVGGSIEAPNVQLSLVSPTEVLGSVTTKKIENAKLLHVKGPITGNVTNYGQLISHTSIENLDFASEFKNGGVVVAPVINYPQAKTFESLGSPNYRAISSSSAYQDPGVYITNHDQALTALYQSFTSTESYKKLNQSGLKGVYLPLTPILPPLTMDLFIQKMGGKPRNLDTHLPFLGSMGENASSLAPPSTQNPYFYISQESHLSQALVPYQSTPLFIGHTPNTQEFYPYLLDPALEAKFIYEFLTQTGKDLIEIPADLSPEMIWAALRQNGARYGITLNALMSRNGTSQAMVLQMINQKTELAHPILFYHLMPVNGTMMYVPHLWMKGLDHQNQSFMPVDLSHLRPGTIIAKQVNVGGIGQGSKMSIGGDSVIAQLKAINLQSFHFGFGSPQIGQAMIQADEVAIHDRVKLGEGLIKFNKLITDQNSYTEANLLGLIGQHVINQGKIHAKDHGLFYVDYWQNIKGVLCRRLTPDHVNSWEIQHRDEPEFEYIFQEGGDVTGRNLTFWVRRLENNLALISATDQLDLIIQELVSTGVIKTEGLLNYKVVDGRIERAQNAFETTIINKTTKKRFWGLSKKTIYSHETIQQTESFPADKSGVLEANQIITGGSVPDMKFLQLVGNLLPSTIGFIPPEDSHGVQTLIAQGATIKVGKGGLQLRGALDFIVLPNVDISLGSYTKSSRSFFHSNSSSSATRKERIVRPSMISIAGMDIEFGRDISLTATDVTAVKTIKMKAGNTVSLGAAYARTHNHETHQATIAEVTKVSSKEGDVRVKGYNGVNGEGTEIQAPEGLIIIKAPQGNINFRHALQEAMIKVNNDSRWMKKETTTTSQSAIQPTFIAKKGVCFAASENCAIHLSAPRIMATNGDVVFNAGVLDIMGQILKNTYSSSNFSATQTENIYHETPVFVPYQIISNGTIYFNVNTANLRGGDIVAHTIIDDSEHMTLGAVTKELNYSYSRSGFSNGGHKTTDTKGGKEHMLPTSLHLTGDWISTHKANGTLNWQGVIAMIMGNLSVEKSFHLSAQELKEWSETTTTFVGMSNPVWEAVNAIASGKRVGAALEDFVKNDPWVAAFDKLIHMDMKGPDGKVNLLLNAINGYCRTVDLADGIGNISDMKSFGSFLKDRYSAVSLKVTQDNIKTQSMTDVGSNVTVRGKVYVNAPEWSIKGGSHVKAKTVEAFVKKFTMDAGKTTFKQETSGWNASMSMGADGGMSASGGMYDHEIYQKIYQASTLTADKVFLRVSEDMILRGSRVLADELDVKVEGNLWVESVQDEYREKGRRAQASTNATPSGGVTDKESRTTGDGKAALKGKTSEKIEVKGTTTEIHPEDYHRDNSFHLESLAFDDWKTVQKHVSNLFQDFCPPMDHIQPYDISPTTGAQEETYGTLEDRIDQRKDIIRDRIKNALKTQGATSEQIQTILDDRYVGMVINGAAKYEEQYLGPQVIVGIGRTPKERAAFMVAQEEQHGASTLQVGLGLLSQGGVALDEFRQNHPTLAGFTLTALQVGLSGPTGFIRQQVIEKTGAQAHIDELVEKGERWTSKQLQERFEMDPTRTDFLVSGGSFGMQLAFSSFLGQAKEKVFDAAKNVRDRGERLLRKGKVEKNAKPKESQDFSQFDKSSSTPVGYKGKEKELKVKPGSNGPTIISDRYYSGHALDRMQERGLKPSIVENAIKNGDKMPGNLPDRIAHYDPVNKITVVTGKKDGNVITVRFGEN